LQVLELIIFAGLAAIVLYQLYSVLGRRVGRQPEDQPAPEAAPTPIRVGDRTGLAAEEAVYAYAFDGRRYDCGSKLGYLEATVDFGLKHPETGAGFARFLAQRDH